MIVPREGVIEEESLSMLAKWDIYVKDVYNSEIYEYKCMERKSPSEMYI